jgi:predicted dehydrogenase
MPVRLTDDQPVRWGILGAGGIAGKVSADIVATEGNVVAAVAARDAGRAADFAGRCGADRSYASYADLAADPDIDVIYVATTHPHHKEQALLAIEAGKSVLIEKPVCLNAADTHEVFEAANKADVFAMEAMWMRTNPLVCTAEQLIADGVIGEVRAVRAELGLGRPFDASHRLYDLANGGGALLDLGIYPVTFAWLFLGRPDTVSVAGSLSPTGSDATVAMQWHYADGRDAQLWCSVGTEAPNRGLIMGSEGWIMTESRFHRPSGLVVKSADGEARIADPIAGTGFGYGPEIAEVARCLRAGLTESPLIPHGDTIAIMELLDAARAELGVKYPGE